MSLNEKNPLEVLAQTHVEASGFTFTHDLRNNVMLRLAHAQATVETPEVVQELVKVALAKAPLLLPLQAAGTMRTASVRSCPRCKATMVVARISQEQECDYCPGCRVTEPR